MYSVSVDVVKEFMFVIVLSSVGSCSRNVLLSTRRPTVQRMFFCMVCCCSLVDVFWYCLINPLVEVGPSQGRSYIQVIYQRTLPCFPSPQQTIFCSHLIVVISIWCFIQCFLLTKSFHWFQGGSCCPWPAGETVVYVWENHGVCVKMPQLSHKLTVALFTAYIIQFNKYILRFFFFNSLLTLSAYLQSK